MEIGRTFLLSVVVLAVMGCTSFLLVDDSPVATSPPAPVTGTPTPALRPYPYTTPLPPPTPTILDGVYSRVVENRGTATPCRRCPAYKLESGEWTLTLTAGAYRVSHPSTGFQGVGSFTVSGSRIAFFNDPNCHTEVGRYTWRVTGDELALQVLDDPCGFGLRAKNLTYRTWMSLAQGSQNADACQPPSLEAAISGHWPIPAHCRELAN